MILNGDGRSHIKVLDSIEEYKFKNNHFSICITNPPFGTNTKWEKDINIMNEYHDNAIFNRLNKNWGYYF